MRAGIPNTVGLVNASHCSVPDTGDRSLCLRRTCKSDQHPHSILISLALMAVEIKMLEGTYMLSPLVSVYGSAFHQFANAFGAC